MRTVAQASHNKSLKGADPIPQYIHRSMTTLHNRLIREVAGPFGRQKTDRTNVRGLRREWTGRCGCGGRPTVTKMQTWKAAKPARWLPNGLLTDHLRCQM